MQSKFIDEIQDTLRLCAVFILGYLFADDGLMPGAGLLLAVLCIVLMTTAIICGVWLFGRQPTGTQEDRRARLTLTLAAAALLSLSIASGYYALHAGDGKNKSRAVWISA